MRQYWYGLIWILCSTATLAQVSISATITVEPLAFPYIRGSQDDTLLVPAAPSPSLLERTDKVIPHISDKSFSQYAFPLDNLGKDYLVAAIANVDSDSVVVVFDRDFTDTYEEREVRRVRVEELDSITVDYRGTSLFFQYIVHTGADRVGKMELTPLHRFKAVLQTENNSYTVHLNRSFLGIHLWLEGSGQSYPKQNATSYSLNEPFLLGDHHYKLVKLDLAGPVATFDKLPRDEIAYGYREGYYVSVPEAARLSALTPSQQTTLYYFYGTWCGPCVKNIDKTKAIQDYVKATPDLEMQYVATGYSAYEEEKEKLADFIKRHHLLENQLYISFKDRTSCPQAIAFKKDCDLLGLLRITSYPTYVLVDAQGRIVYRGANADDELLRLLQQDYAEH